MTLSECEVLLLFLGREHVDPYRLGIGWNRDAANGIVAGPVLFDGVLEKRAQGVKVVTHGDVAHSVLVHAPGLVGFNSALVNQAHHFRAEECARTGQADRDAPAAIGMSSILRLRPVQKHRYGIIELPNYHPPGRLPAFKKRLAMLRLALQRAPHVLFCGGQICGAGVVPAIQPKPVIPFSVPHSQTHGLSPAVRYRATLARALLGTRFSAQSEESLALCVDNARSPASPARARDYRPAPPGKANFPLG